MTETLIPIESNPEILNKFLQKLGVPDKWEIIDVMGLDPELLNWVPRPVISVILLFPESDAYIKYKEKEEHEIMSKGQEVSNNIFYMKQIVDNACGTIALVHSLANNCDKIKFSEGPMKKFLDEAKGLDAEARGMLFQNSDTIIRSHKELAQEGQTNTPRAEDPVEHHFIAFVHKDGFLYELDGSKSFPINHGPTNEDTLLEDAAKICKEFMARDPNELRFTVLALTATS